MTESGGSSSSPLTERLDALLSAEREGTSAIGDLYAQDGVWRIVDSRPERMARGRARITNASREFERRDPHVVWTRGLSLESENRVIGFLAGRDPASGRTLHAARHLQFDADGGISTDDRFIDFGVFARPLRDPVAGIDMIAAPSTAVASESDEEETNADRIRDFYDALNERKRPRVAEIYAERARLVDANSREVVIGRRSIVRAFDEIWSATPAYRAEPLRILAAGNFVVAIHIVLLDPPRRNPEAPRPRQIEELVLFEMHHQRIASEWTFFNSEVML